MINYNTPIYSKEINRQINPFKGAVGGNPILPLEPDLRYVLVTTYYQYTGGAFAFTNGIRVIMYDLDNPTATPTLMAGTLFNDGYNGDYKIMGRSNLVSTTTSTLAERQDIFIYGNTTNYQYIDLKTSNIVTVSNPDYIGPTSSWNPVLLSITGSYDSKVYLFGGYFNDSVDRVNYIQISGVGANFLTGSSGLPDPPFLMGGNDIYSNSPFVGSESPGNIPLVTSGIRYAKKNVPFFTITDQSNTDRTLECGIRRSNVYTALQAPSSRENKGQFNTWYMDVKTSNNIVINNQGWSGKTPEGDFSQGDTDPVYANTFTTVGGPVLQNYAPSFQYKSNVYTIGGGSSSAPTSNAWKCSLLDLPNYPSDTSASNAVCTTLTGTPDPFYAGAAALDAGNEKVYLFGPDNSTYLWSIGFDKTNHAFTGTWSNVSPTVGFDYTTITLETGTHNTPISYHDGYLWVIGGLRDDPTIAVTNSFTYDLGTNKWILTPLLNPGGGAVSHYPRATQQINFYKNADEVGGIPDTSDLSSNVLAFCTQDASGAVNSCDTIYTIYTMVSGTVGCYPVSTLPTPVENPIMMRSNLDASTVSTYTGRMDMVIFNTAAGAAQPYQYIDVSDLRGAGGPIRYELTWSDCLIVTGEPVEAQFQIQFVDLTILIFIFLVEKKEGHLLANLIIYD